MLTLIYRKLIPLALREKIYNRFLGKILFFFRNLNIIAKSKLIFCLQWILPKTEENKAYAFIGKYGITSYPYSYMLEYKNLDITVEFDKEYNLPFVLHNKKKLFFPAEYETDKIILDYKCLLIEQDDRSAHRYVRAYSELKNKTLLDIGSADGSFALDTIELVDRAYLFECEDFWITALEATFAPWKEKVSIIRKYVGDKTSNNFITIDGFLIDKSIDNLFIKMDIEGAEMSAILGATNTLKHGKNINLAVCTYHRKGDPENFSRHFQKLGYQYEFSDGLVYWQKKLSKGIIRCQN